MKALLPFVLFGVIVALAAASRPNYCGIDNSNPPINPTFSNPPAGYRLVQVNALIRHGDRLPIDSCWANDSIWNCNLNIEERSTSDSNAYDNVSRLHRKRYIDGAEIFPGGCMAGQLTKYGYDQHLTNGANLRNQYVNSGFLPRSIDTSTTYLRSTDVPRTLQSAQGLLRALYPWSTGLNATEFLDVHTVDAAREYLYPNPGNCPKLLQYETQAKASSDYQNFIQNTLTPLMTQAASYYNLPLNRMPTPIAVFDCLSAHRCHNMALPGNLPESLYNQIVQAMEWEYKYIYNYPSRVEYGQLAMGQLYTELYNNMLAALTGGKANKFNLFSAHDTSVMPFLNAIGAWDGIWAPYASLVQMELYTPSNNQQQPLVRWIYNRREIVLPGCTSTFCPFSTFTQAVEPLLLKNPAQSCSLNGNVRRSENLGVYTHGGW